ncbi:pyrrolo-quinoline quinone [Lipomyces chichibuensis]|uniref:pyrrolo-quinoline quinone n=1 Tax=Lipomyces chichibuensis TaxID=1546026 RepID=UPI0033437D51
MAAINVLTYHYDTASTGVNPYETQLNPLNVKAPTFGKLFTTPVDGAVYTEPLIYTGVVIADGVNTNAGAPGLHNVVFVATEHDSLYAIDADNGAVLWKRTFLDTTNPGNNINNTLNATEIVPVAAYDVDSGTISPEIGITGTPVIDQGSNLLYVVPKTKEIIRGITHFVQRLHAINVSDGSDAATPFLIGDTTTCCTRNFFSSCCCLWWCNPFGKTINNTQIYVYGNGDGSILDPAGTGKRIVQFNAQRQNQRSALSLVSNHVYVQWASHGDNGPYHGWVLAWNVADIKGSTGFQLTGVLNTSPNNGMAGIWESGGRLVFESDGTTFYFASGNGTGGAPTLDLDGFPTNVNFQNSLVKVVPDPTTNVLNQNPNGWGLKIIQYFMPYNVASLDLSDLDFGAGGPLLLPDNIGAHPHLMITGGKEGKIYLFDRDTLGGFNSTNDNVLNAVNSGGHMTPPVQIGAALSTAAYFNNTIYWVSGQSDRAYAYVINPTQTALVVTSQTVINDFGDFPGSVIVSANGIIGGIVWIMDRRANQIHAYDATNLGTELWNSGQIIGDNLGSVVKFAVPTVANGQVYVGTRNSLVVYGKT